MAYSLNRTPALDSLLITSCNPLAPNHVNAHDKTYTFQNVQSDYWNIDDILAEEEMVPCTFKSDVKKLAHLDMMAHNAAINKQTITAQDQGTLKAKTKVDLPLALAVALARIDLVTISPPVYLSDKFMSLFKVDPQVVNLRSHSSFLYENLLKLSSHLPSDSIYSYITKYQECFIDRFCRLMLEMADSQEVLNNDQFATDMKRMTNLEREVFEIHKR